MKIYLVRHGETEWNALRKRQGRTDIPLNDNGIRQANELHEKTKDLDFDICYCSPLSRARQTAEIVIGGKCKIVFDDLLLERDAGQCEGTDGSQDLGATDDAWDFKLNASYGGMETIRDLLARAKTILLKIIKLNPDDSRIIVVAHNGILRAIHWNIVGYDENTVFRNHKIGNGDFREYSFKKETLSEDLSHRLV